MEKAIEKIISISIELQELFAFISSFTSDQELNEKVKKYIYIDNPIDFNTLMSSLNSLYSGLELMAFIISDKDGVSSQIVDSMYMKNVKIGDHLKKLDELANSLYRMAKKNPELETKSEKKVRSTTDIKQVYNELKLSANPFSFLNPEFLLPTEDLLDELPKNAVEVNINIKNTQHLISGLKKLINVDYVKQNYPTLQAESGVTTENLDRYPPLLRFPNVGETNIIPLNSENVYQKLGDKYRKLTHYPENDYVRNYDFLPMNTNITNFENKRITMCRQNIPKNKLYTPIEDKSIGLIKNNYANKNMTMADSIFKALYHENMTDEQVTKLGMGSYVVQGGLADNKAIVLSTFNRNINKNTMKKIL